MVAKAGRLASIYWRPIGDTEWTLTPGAREKSMSINNAPVDITSDDDLGWKTSLADVSASRDWSLKVGGVLKDDALIVVALAQASVEVMYVTGLDYYVGTARVVSAEVPAGQEDPITYDVSFEGSGALVRTAGSPTL